MLAALVVASVVGDSVVCNVDFFAVVATRTLFVEDTGDGFATTKLQDMNSRTSW